MPIDLRDIQPATLYTTSEAAALMGAANGEAFRKQMKRRGIRPAAKTSPLRWLGSDLRGTLTVNLRPMTPQEKREIARNAVRATLAAKFGDKVRIAVKRAKRQATKGGVTCQ